MINNLGKKSEELFLVSLCYKSIINELIYYYTDVKNHVRYNVQIPIKLRRLLTNIVRAAITCKIIDNEHYIDVLCDVILTDSMFSHKKMEVIVHVLNDIFFKINNTLKKE
jgi:hypothetical protein